ncbi:serine hydrolase [Alteromonas sp. C1M14]|uniref:serine hydrolase domain-containing protein n=1 Tax=Alteromonas sp. C1M14 TaxID=2841567 RepID=UPI001C0866A4|nr:serine hydrolase [Alteromonas sp. C1M14]MBU2979901.1 serine hydrolase [Alteromonas sp. C1M14]
MALKDVLAKSSVSLNNWQLNRKLGLRQLQHILPDLMSVNARTTRPLTASYDKVLAAQPQLKALSEQPDIDGFVVLKGSHIVFEHYADDFSPSSLHSAQSATKPVSILLLEKAILAGRISIHDNVEQYIPEIGDGFHGRSVKDIMGMNVLHEFNEMTAYTAPAGSRLEQIRFADERSFGYLPLNEHAPISRRDFAKSLKRLPHHSSNENTHNTMVYATINTEVSGWILERAMDKPLTAQVRELMHQIGGEDTVYMSVDHEGIPSIGAGLILTTRDFARYGMLLRDCTCLPAARKEAITKMPNSSNKYSLSLTVSETGYSHSGWGGQYLFVCPKTDIVVVVFGGINGDDPMPKSYFDNLESITAAIVAYYNRP